MSTKGNNTRLFVPLSSQPYKWFKSGLKKWEIRRYGRQYTEKHVYVGKHVELRRGYSDKTSALWGVIEDVEYAKDPHTLFVKVPFKEAIPIALSLEEAIAQVEFILRLQSNQQRNLVAFKIKFSEWDL